MNTTYQNLVSAKSNVSSLIAQQEEIKKQITAAKRAQSRALKSCGEFIEVELLPIFRDIADIIYSLNLEYQYQYMSGNIETCVFGYSSDKIKASNIHFDSDCLPYICYNLNDGLNKLAGYSESGIDESQFNQLKQAVIAKYPNIDFTLYPYTANGRYSFAGCILYVTLAI